MKVAFNTLGCKVNQNDTQGLMGLFQQHGYEIVPYDCGADVYVINTCAVTQIGERKSRQTIRKALELNPAAIVVVTGCYAQTAPQEIAAIPGVNLVVGMADRPRLVELVEEFQRHQENLIQVGTLVEPIPWINLPVTNSSERTRATLKIEEGCNQFCTYCIVPYARGRVRSMPRQLAIEEFHHLLDLGYREIVLTGIHLGSYGKDLGVTLIDLLRDLTNISGDFRIRLGSIEPHDFPESLVELIINNPKICQYLHIPLQSGSDRILKLMNRGYSLKYFRELIAKLREKNDLVAIGTDLIVGFPGESQKDFETTCDFLREEGFSRMHIFRFSPRPNTPASRLPGRIPRKIQEERSKLVQAIADQASSNYAARFINRKVMVLFEEQKAEFWTGLSGEYLRVNIAAPMTVNLKNTLTPVIISEQAKDYLIGNIKE